MPPIFSTSTFKHGNKDNFDYTRSGNPNFRILENILKSIEDSKYCTVFGSGISAVTAITSTLKSGDKILCESNLYGCTVRMFEKIFKKFGVEVLYTDFTNKNNIKKPGFKTLSIHHGETFAEDTGCVMPPIFSTLSLIHI